jgi:NADH:ubiquinone reductase (H+-translocating)
MTINQVTHPTRSDRRHRVVVIGAGFGGLAVARGLRDEAVDVTLIDANNFHTFQPLVYQVATAGLAVDDIAHATRGVFHHQHNVDVLMARVTEIDLERREVHTTAGVSVDYDSLVIAVGAVSHDFGTPGVASNAMDLKTLDDAVALRNHVLERFEAATANPSTIDDGQLNVVICGGGPTGVELAGAFSELFGRVLAKDFPHLDVERCRIVVVEGSDRLLGKFSEQSSARARIALGKRGVEVMTDVKVRSIEPAEVHLSNGSTLRAQTIVWAAGVRGHPLAETLGVPLARDGRIIVDPDLSVPGHPEVFAIGDISVNPRSPLPQLALPAVQGGKHTARQIGRRLAGRATEPFAYRDLGTMATIGRHDAVAEFPNGVRLAGVPGWIAWLGLHVVRLMGFRNRANVLVNWFWNYATYDRASRLLSESAASTASNPTVVRVEVAEGRAA